MMQSFNPTQIEQDIIKQKKRLRELSSNYKTNFENIEKKILIEVEEIEKLTTKNKKIIPEINYSDIKNKLINNEIFDLVKKRGCVVIRNVFEKEKVIEWKLRDILMKIIIMRIKKKKQVWINILVILSQENPKFLDYIGLNHK